MPQGRQILCTILLCHLVTFPEDLRLGSLHTWTWDWWDQPTWVCEAIPAVGED